MVVVETGRIRGLVAYEGHSTLRFVGHPNVQKVYSIDSDKKTEELTKIAMADTKWFHAAFGQMPSFGKIVFITADSITGLQSVRAVQPFKTVDLLFLDTANDPALIMKEFEMAEPLLKDKAVIIIDDVYNGGVKGDMLIPHLQQQNQRIDAWRDFAIIEYERKA